MQKTFIMMCGLPGSGKSYQAAILADKYNAIILNSDEYRERIGTSINDQSVTPAVFKAISADSRHLLQEGRSIIMDATNLASKRRKSLLNEAKRYAEHTICVVVLRPYEDCKAALHGRDHDVPDYVLDRMYKSFDTPFYCEGWDEIQLIYTGDCEKQNGDPFKYVESLMNYEQDNLWHKETLGQHLSNTSDRLEETGNYDLIIAGLLHDVGKPFCKTFQNMKGETSEYAHYYGHEYVGAYESLFFDLKGADKLHVSWLIANHMKPHSWERNESKKSIWKAHAAWGDELFSEVMMLAAADDESKTSGGKMNAS